LQVYLPEDLYADFKALVAFERTNMTEAVTEMITARVKVANLPRPKAK